MIESLLISHEAFLVTPQCTSLSKMLSRVKVVQGGGGEEEAVSCFFFSFFFFSYCLYTFLDSSGSSNSSSP